jgi:hypothetical protein
MKWCLGVAAVLGGQALASAAFIPVPRAGVSVVAPDTVDPVGSFSPDFYQIEDRDVHDDHIDVILNLGAPVEIDKFTYQNRLNATTNSIPSIFSLAVGDGVDDGVNFNGGLGPYTITPTNTAAFTQVAVDLPAHSPKQYYRFRILRTINGDTGTQLNSQVRDFLYEAVPEPASIGLLAMGLPMLLRRRRR